MKELVRLCPGCKRKIIIKNSNGEFIKNDGVIYLKNEDKFYHSDCYKPNRFITKCACKSSKYHKKSDLIEDNGVYYKGKNYHIECFTDMCNEISPKTNKPYKSKVEALKNIELYKQDYISNMNDMLKSRSNQLFNLRQDYLDKVDEMKIEHEFIEFIKYNYNIISFNNVMWKKIKDITSGNYKDLTMPIPLSHIYDMWKRRINKLNQYYNNVLKAKGTIMSGQQRFNYDLSVLLSKYDSYLSWLNKQNNNANNIEIVNDIILPKNIRKEKEDNDLDISSLIDEL